MMTPELTANELPSHGGVLGGDKSQLLRTDAFQGRVSPPAPAPLRRNFGDEKEMMTNKSSRKISWLDEQLGGSRNATDCCTCVSSLSTPTVVEEGDPSSSSPDDATHSVVSSSYSASSSESAEHDFPSSRGERRQDIVAVRSSSQNGRRGRGNFWRPSRSQPRPSSRTLSRSKRQSAPPPPKNVHELFNWSPNSSSSRSLTGCRSSSRSQMSDRSASSASRTSATTFPFSCKQHSSLDVNVVKESERRRKSIVGASCRSLYFADGMREKEDGNERRSKREVTERELASVFEW